METHALDIDQQGKAIAQAKKNGRASKYFEFHELSEIYPMVDGLGWRIEEDGRPVIVDNVDSKRWAQFVSSIRTHGLINPIVMYEGKILDGRNRYIACLEAGAKPRFVEVSTIVPNWDNLTPDQQRDKAERVAFDANRKREHYGNIEKALIVLPFYRRLVMASYRARMARATASRDGRRMDAHEPVRAKVEAAKMAGVTPSSIDRAARLVKVYGEEIVDEIIGDRLKGPDGKRESPEQLLTRSRGDRLKERGTEAALEREERERQERERAALDGNTVIQQEIINKLIDTARRKLDATSDVLHEIERACSRYGWTHLDLTAERQLAGSLDSVLKAIEQLP